MPMLPVNPDSLFPAEPQEGRDAPTERVGGGAGGPALPVRPSPSEFRRRGRQGIPRPLATNPESDLGNAMTEEQRERQHAIIEELVARAPEKDRAALRAAYAQAGPIELDVSHDESPFAYDPMKDMEPPVNEPRQSPEPSRPRGALPANPESRLGDPESPGGASVDAKPAGNARSQD